MTVAFTPNGWADYLYWQDNDADHFKKTNDLIKDISRDPFRGLGKPEPLRGTLTGYCSRRISEEHRLVYFVSGTRSKQTLTIIQARFHYQ